METPERTVTKEEAIEVMEFAIKQRQDAIKIAKDHPEKWDGVRLQGQLESAEAALDLIRAIKTNEQIANDLVFAQTYIGQLEVTNKELLAKLHPEAA